MYEQRRPYRSPQRYSHVVHHRRRRRLPTKEILWRASWPDAFTLILALLMFLLTIIIFVLEIASLAIDNSNTLSNTASTGAGIWCSIVFLIPVIFMYLLVLACDSSRIWSTYTLITHLVALIFICVLIALDANAVTPYNSILATAPTKIKILKGQLAIAVLMFLFPIGFLAAYILTAFNALFSFRPHKHSVYPPFPIPSRIVKY